MTLSSERTVIQAAELILLVFMVFFSRLGSVNLNTGADIGHSKKQVKVSIFFPSISRFSCIPVFFKSIWRIFVNCEAYRVLVVCRIQ